MPKSMQYAAGSIVFFEGDKDDSIFILQSGKIILQSTDLETGAEIIEQLHKGEFFGVKSALAHMPRIVTAQAIEDSVVVSMTPLEFEKIFSTKQQVTEKMLRVFSKTLREIHQQTEAILRKDAVETPAGQGMFSVAQAFYNDEEYHTACDILKRVLEHHTDSVDIYEVQKFYKDALLKAEQQAHEQSRLASRSVTETAAPAVTLNQFSLPVFDRFTKNYKRGDVIISEFEPGEKFYLIKSGKVQIIKTMNGQNKALDMLNTGEFFGEMAILDNSPRTATCVARVDTACLEFSKENFSTLVLGNSQIVMNLLKLFCKRICDQRRRFKIILINEIPARIADIFLMYEELYSAKGSLSFDEESTKRRYDVTVGDIANWAGIPQNVARDELFRMADKRKIEIYDNYMVVNNIHDMRRVVDAYYKKMASLNSTLGKKNLLNR